MPHLVKMDKRYAKKGLRIIAGEVQGSDDKAIKDIVADYRMKFMVTQGLSGPIEVRSIPRSFVFDPSGKLVFEGNPVEEAFEDAVKDALKLVGEEPVSEDGASTTPLIAEQTWTNAEGKPLQAAVISTTGDSVTFLLPNGSEVDYPLAKLSEADQETIRKAAE